ncbi:unnamed protein product [Linum tenue]|uniref:GTD-binding domain-containing protein n=1 Tax=Linum tenue TaxID=586396 RepID=A0AAV0KDZ6_9ROSI|nr:unnamed protein product [Linum tenue]
MQQIVSRFCLLLVICSVLEFHQRILRFFLGIFVMECAACLKFLAQISEFRGGFIVFGCFSQAFNFLWLFLLFAFGLKLLKLTSFGIGLIQLLQYDIRGKSIDPRNGFSSRKGFDLAFHSKVVSFNKGCLAIENLKSTKDKDDSDSEDDEFDVLALRRLVRKERRRAVAAQLELEKERMAAASATDEAMAMILRLQNEKSSAEMDAKQYRRMAEQKQEYDQEVIQSFQWNIMRHEYERSLLEEKLKLCRQQLQRCLRRDEMEELDAALDSLGSTSDCGLDEDELMMEFESPAATVQAKVFQEDVFGQNDEGIEQHA